MVNVNSIYLLTDAVFPSNYLNKKTLASRVVISSWLPASPSNMEPSEDHQSTHRHPTGFRKQPE